jgi:hypothetical protein
MLAADLAELPMRRSKFWIGVQSFLQKVVAFGRIARYFGR